LLIPSFESRNFPEPADMPLGPAELRPQEGNQEFPRYGGPDDPAAHTENVHIVVLDSLMGRKMVMNQARPNAWNLIRAD
jgi:hypothetical protein